MPKKGRGSTLIGPKAASKLMSVVWEHFRNYDRELFTHRDGKKVYVGHEKRAICVYYGVDLKADSSFNGTSSLCRHV